MSRLWGLLLVASVAAACTPAPRRPTTPGPAKVTRPTKKPARPRPPAARPEPPPDTAADGVQEGIASWYGGKHHRGPTASGERFDKHALTAAHRTLPFGTRVRVTRVKNGRTVTVRINDRGPFSKGRIIDLSEAAARALDMLEDGIAKVRLEVLP